MQKFSLIFLLLILAHGTESHAQNFQWLKTASKEGACEGLTVRCGNQGHVIVSGDHSNFGNPLRYKGEMDFGIASFSGVGSFLASYDRPGNLDWVENLEGTIYIVDIAFDKNGNIYVTGCFTDTVSFGGAVFGGKQGQVTTSFKNTVLHSRGKTDIFLAKYSADGIFSWVKQAGGKDEDYGRGLKIDNDDNVFLTGCFRDTAEFSDIRRIAAGDQDMFLARYDSHGNVIWVQRIGDEGWSDSKSIALDAQGNIYIAGYIGRLYSFPPYTEDVGSLFIASYDKNGNVRWSKENRSIAYPFLLPFDPWIFANGTDVFVCCFPQKDAEFSGVKISDNGNLTIAKYSSSGEFAGVKTIGISDVYLELFSVCMDQYNNLYLTGSFDGEGETMHIDGQPLKSWDMLDIFVVKYDPEGKIKWAVSGGGKHSDWSQSICVDEKGTVFITGETAADAIYGNCSVNAKANGYYIASLASDPAGIFPEPDPGLSIGLRVYPIPAREKISVEFPKSGPERLLKLYNTAGCLVKTTSCRSDKASMDIDGLPSGIYLLRINSAEGESERKIIIE
jgi:hypothetical protein